MSRKAKGGVKNIEVRQCSGSMSLTGLTSNPCASFTILSRLTFLSPRSIRPHSSCAAPPNQRAFPAIAFAVAAARGRAYGNCSGLCLLAVFPYIIGFSIEYWWGWVPPLVLAPAGLASGGLEGLMIFGTIGVVGILVGKWWSDRRVISGSKTHREYGHAEKVRKAAGASDHRPIS
jgi:hypothetical protein